MIPLLIVLVILLTFYYFVLPDQRPIQRKNVQLVKFY